MTEKERNEVIGRRFAVFGAHADTIRRLDLDFDLLDTIERLITALTECDASLKVHQKLRWQAAQDVRTARRKTSMRMAAELKASGLTIAAITQTMTEDRDRRRAKDGDPKLQPIHTRTVEKWIAAQKSRAAGPRAAGRDVEGPDSAND
jgi:hypothetical protein